CCKSEQQDAIWTEDTGSTESATAGATQKAGYFAFAESVPNGFIALRAADGVGMGPSIRFMADWNAFGWFTPKDSVVWKATVREPGLYQVYLEWSVSDDEAGKDMVVRCGNSSITSQVNRSGSWETFAIADIGEMFVQGGEQV